MARKVHLIGAGMGNPGTLTGDALDALAASELVIGAQRLLDGLPALACETRALTRADDIACALAAAGAETAAVLFSGDVGFYSGAKLLAERLTGFDVEAIPGISSVSYFCAKLLVPWQDVHLVSAHGRNCDAAAEIRAHARAFFITGGQAKAQDLCADLAAAGLGNALVHVGERLSYPDERIVSATAAEIAAMEFSDLSVMLVERRDGEADVTCLGGLSHRQDPPARSAAREPRSLLRSASPRILVASPASGAGKTMFACGLMRALVNRGLSVRACKCGPDYIDPMFHREVVGVESRNIDLFFMGDEGARHALADSAQGADITVVEGAMGFYDGISTSDRASTWDTARTTGTPVVLVVDGRGRARSIAAEVAGFARFRNPSCIAGVVLNRISAGMFARLKEDIERETGVPALGHLPVLDDCQLESRHLGLVAASEVDGLQDKLARLARAIEESVDLDALLSIAQSASAVKGAKKGLGSLSTSPDVTVLGGLSHRQVPPARSAGNRWRCDSPPRPVPSGPFPAPGTSPRIAVARDEAFCFYYAEALRLMERFGAELVEFSPLSDERLPSGACGLYLGGGYPELHAQALSGNAVLMRDIRSAIEDGMPTVAECGGFMYIHEQMEDDQGVLWPMVGAVAGAARKTGKLVRFGYATLTAREDNLLCGKGEALGAHEFHYWDSDDPGSSFHAEKPLSGQSWDCVHATPALYAGYPHVFLPAHPRAVEHFVGACASYGAAKGGGGDAR